MIPFCVLTQESNNRKGSTKLKFQLPRSTLYYIIMILTPQQIFGTMRKAGFPNDIEVSPGVSVAVCMTAIALRESGGDQYAFNGDVLTSDRSYGLLQINMLALGAYWGPFGLNKERDLFKPAVNAHAGFVLWGGNNNNLNVAWYIDKPGYKEAYEAELPAAQAAAKAG